VSISISGDKELRANLKRLGFQMNDAVDKGVMLTAQEVRTTAIKSIQAKSQGKAVTRSRQGGGVYAHIAAAAGQAPNTDTGKLVASIAAEKVKDGHYVVGTNLDYGAFLELGTSRMPLPRPWLEPALRQNIDNLTENVKKVTQAMIKKL
jgi:HK97 gp10 family phage protein